jgi:hypothetical protein
MTILFKIMLAPLMIGVLIAFSLSAVDLSKRNPSNFQLVTPLKPPVALEQS